MAHDERKRQKKLERKKAKRREAMQQTEGFAGDWPSNPDTQARLPVYDCQVSSRLFESGIGPAVVARTLSNGYIAVGVFLLDVYCLGIKNAYFRLMAPAEYREQLRRMRQTSPMEHKQPSYAKKLVEAAEAWARGLGFTPHDDYHDAKRVLAGIDAGECDEQFVFGQNGQPHYISGPFDKPFRVTQIMQTLARTCGQGNFHYTIAVDPKQSVMLESEE